MKDLVLESLYSFSRRTGLSLDVDIQIIERIFKEHTEQREEIERLNNIINELEEYICAIEYDERHSDSWQIPVRIHNKLKELKGSDKD